MQHRVVEGEPGISPEPIAAALRAMFWPLKGRRRPGLGLIVLTLGAAVALVPFHQLVRSERMPSTYSADCGVPARTALRKVDRRWKTYMPGVTESTDAVPPSNPVPACFTPARQRTLLGAVLALAGVLIGAISWRRVQSERP